jgi:tetratricopeptide (TPR) repeat protein
MYSRFCPSVGPRRPVRSPHDPRSLLLVLLLGALPAGLAVPAALPAAAASPAAAATAAEPWDGRFFTASPAELLAAAAAAETDDGKPVAMLLLEARYSFDEAGRLSRTTRMAYRIRSANADPSWSEVGAGWLPWHQQRPRMRARVVTPDGQEHRLDPKVLEQSTVGGGDPEMFAERQVLRGPLPAIGPGAVVEEEETVVDSAPAFERGTLERQGLGMSVPVRHARVVIEAPGGMPLHYVVELLPALAPRRETTASGGQRLVFEIRGLPAVAAALPGLPPEAPRQPGIAFSNGASWREIAEEYSRIVDRAAAGAQLTDWLRGAGAFNAAESQLELIQRVLGHMTGIRYTGVELGEGSIVPRSPAETLARRFGDCKDKSVLLAAALRALDIPAYVALLAAGEDERDVDPALPGFGAFDHAIVYVPGTPAVWIDPTDPYARVGELPIGDQGRNALVAAPGVAALTRTAASSASENRVLKTREFFLADSGPARVVETIEYSGAAERRQRAYFATIQADALHKEIDEYAQRVFYGKTAAAFDHSDPRDLSRPLRRRMEVNEAKRGYTDPATALVAVSYSTLFDLLPDDLTADEAENDAKAGGGSNAKAAPRRADYYFDMPHTVEVRYRVVPPAGYEPEDLPASRVRQLGTMALSEQYSAGEQGITSATLRLDSGKQRIAPAELASLRSALAQLTKDRVLMLRFRQIGESQAAAGHVREALQEFRKEATAAPAKALPHLRTARALLAGGLGEAARREAERGIQLEPRSAAAYGTLGWILQHDAVGRRFGPGFSRDQALAAYAKAKQLDPSLTVARADYAILLEHDAHGQRYMPGSDLPAAIAEYRSLRKDYDEDELDDNLLVDLLYAGRTDEALELAGAMKASENKPAVIAAATALKEGAEAAIHQVERTNDGPAHTWPVLESAARTLVRLRAYAVAAALLERAGPMSPDASKLLGQAAILRQTHRLDQIPLPAGKPSSVARQALIYAAREDAGPEKFLGLLCGRLTAADQSPRGQFLQQLGQVQKQTRKQIAKTTGLPADLAIELGFAATKETVSGDDALGYRIDYSTVLGNSEGEEFFVVHEGGGYCIAAVSHEPAMLGMEALHRLDAGDLRGARQWLDWGRELTKDPAGDLRLPPFSALWTRGVAADAEQARCAAAALAVGDFAPTALPILRSCRAAAQTEERRVALDAALAATAGKEKRWTEMAEAARRLADARPQAELPFRMEVAALGELGRTAAVVAIANQRLERLPADREAQLVLASADEEKGDFDGAERRLRPLVTAAGASAQELNDLAWLLLLRGRADEQALELAQRATQKPDGKTHGVLHTLGALLAERDRPNEAYQVMVQALNAKSDPVPEAVDWYVFGRMAEQYGLPEEARSLYARVDRPAAHELVSTFHLARARLAAISAIGAPGAR